MTRRKSSGKKSGKRSGKGGGKGGGKRSGKGGGKKGGLKRVSFAEPLTDAEAAHRGDKKVTTHNTKVKYVLK